MSKIGMVLDAHYPDDIRVRKEANALLPKGYEIVLICYGRKGQPAEEVVNGILVKRIINVENKLVKTFHNSWMALTRQHLFFASNLSRIVKEEGIKALHVHDLPLANTSLKVARKHNIPLVLDLHENYPAMVDHNRQHQISLIQKINYNLLFRYQPWFRYERKMIHKADYVITVVEEMKERIMAMHGLPEEKIHIVGNFEEKEFWENRVLRSDEIDPLIDKNKYNLLYIGGLGAHRGLDTVLKGMTLLKDEHPDIHFHIVGGGNYMQTLSKMRDELNLQSSVTLHGRVPFALVGPFMKAVDLNLVPHNSSEHTENTIPHKLFQIMMIDVPILVSSCKPLKRFIEEDDCGYVFEAGNPKDLAEKIVYIKNHPEEAKEKAALARDITINRGLNWEEKSKSLIDLYKEVFKS